MADPAASQRRIVQAIFNSDATPDQKITDLMTVFDNALAAARRENRPTPKAADGIAAGILVGGSIALVACAAYFLLLPKIGDKFDSTLLEILKRYDGTEAQLMTILKETITKWEQGGYPKIISIFSLF